MRAMILAAGIGSRLKEVTKDIPKAMVPIGDDHRIIDTVIDNLTRIGIRDIAVNLHHHRQLLKDYLLRRTDIGWYFSVEEELLNTGGGIYACRKFLEQSDDFIVTNSDILYLFDLERCIRQHRERNSLCTLLVVPSTPQRAVLFRDDEGVLGFTNPQGRLCFDMSHDRTTRDRYGTFTGVSLFSRRIFEHMREGAYSIIDVLAERIKQGERIDFVLLEQDYWNDIGTFEGLERGRRDFDILDHVSQAFGGKKASTFRRLFAGASDKSVYRIVIDDIPRVVTYSKDQRELRSSQAFARYLHRLSVPVPQVILSKPNWLLTEDAGERSLYDIAAEQQSRGEFPREHYNQLIDVLHRLAKIDVATFPVEHCISKQQFDRDNIHFDIRYFNERFHQGRLSTAEMDDLTSAIHELMSSEPVCIMHRDFQSTNVLVNDDLELTIVDLQTLRIGYNIYDLVSLVFDPYVQMDEETMQELLERYYRPIDASRSRDLVWVAAFVRLLQCLATFGAMGDRNAGFYASKIPRALENLAMVIQQIQRCQQTGSLEALRIPDSILALTNPSTSPQGG